MDSLHYEYKTGASNQLDFDGDGLGDACDPDDDNDGTADGSDPCIFDPFNACLPGDADGDGIPDGIDNCPITANPGQEDQDNDLIGDACDGDIDGDGINNHNDPCPYDPLDLCDCTLQLVEFPIYGQGRVGVVHPDIDLYADVSPTTIFSRDLGEKSYELTDHLGNVRGVVSDRKLSDSPGTGGYYAEFTSYTNQYAYGMPQPGRSWDSVNLRYRYGFNGMESDREVTGEDGQHMTTFFRQYDPRVGRWWSNDPVTFPGRNPYEAIASNPIFLSDPYGDDPNETLPLDNPEISKDYDEGDRLWDYKEGLIYEVGRDENGDKKWIVVGVIPKGHGDRQEATATTANTEANGDQPSTSSSGGAVSTEGLSLGSAFINNNLPERAVEQTASAVEPNLFADVDKYVDGKILYSVAMLSLNPTDAARDAVSGLTMRAVYDVADNVYIFGTYLWNSTIHDFDYGLHLSNMDMPHSAANNGMAEPFGTTMSLALTPLVMKAGLMAPELAAMQNASRGGYSQLGKLSFVTEQALQYRLTMMHMTRVGRIANFLMPRWAPRFIQQSYWSQLSKWWVLGTEGEFHVLLGPQINLNSIWLTVELPTLLDLGIPFRVTNILF